MVVLLSAGNSTNRDHEVTIPPRYDHPNSISSPTMPGRDPIFPANMGEKPPLRCLYFRLKQVLRGGTNSS